MLWWLLRGHHGSLQVHWHWWVCFRSACLFWLCQHTRKVNCALSMSQVVSSKANTNQLSIGVGWGQRGGGGRRQGVSFPFSFGRTLWIVTFAMGHIREFPNIHGRSCPVWLSIRWPCVLASTLTWTEQHKRDWIKLNSFVNVSNPSKSAFQTPTYFGLL